MHSRVPMRSIALAAVLMVGIAGFVPSIFDKAQADVVPPFEIVFPQETASTEFTDTFGQGRSGGRSHNGIDLLAPRMTEVYSIAAGVVNYVGTNNLSGRNVKIDHGEGWESAYVHLNNDNPGTDDGQASWDLTVAPGIEEGAKVEAGQLIGWVGDSGNAEGTTSHTHFELRHDGRPLNAYPLLVEAYHLAVELEQQERLAELVYEIE